MEGLNSALVERNVQDSCNREELTGTDKHTPELGALLCRMPVPSQTGHVILGFDTQPQRPPEGLSIAQLASSEDCKPRHYCAGLGKPFQRPRTQLPEMGLGRQGEELTTDHVNVLGQAAVDLNRRQAHLEGTEGGPQSKGSIGSSKTAHA